MLNYNNRNYIENGEITELAKKISKKLTDLHPLDIETTLSTYTHIYRHKFATDSVISPDRLFNHVPSKENTVRCIHLNTKCIPVAYQDFDINDRYITEMEPKDIYIESLNHNTKNIALIVPRDITFREVDFLKELTSDMEKFDMLVLDVGFSHVYSTLKQNDDSYYFALGQGIEKTYHFEPVESNITYLPTLKEEVYSNIANEIKISEKDFDEILDHAVVENIKATLPFINEIDAMKLSSSFKELSQKKQEHFGIATFSKGNLVSVENLFIGSSNRSVVTHHEVMGKILKDKADGFIAFHNHPSGCHEKSSADEMVHRKLNKISHSLDIINIDNLIIGDNGLTSSIFEDNEVEKYMEINELEVKENYLFLQDDEIMDILDRIK